MGPRAKRRLFIALTALLVIGAVEGGARLARWGLEVRRGAPFPSFEAGLSRRHRSAIERALEDTTGYLRLDPDLGWSIRPGGRTPPLYAANARGLRADRAYEAEPRAGIVRIAAIGDSFTHGDEVQVGDSWPSALEGLLDGAEVVNLGVPGYGPGQALLRYRRDGRPLHPRVVLIGFQTENISRALNVYRPFYHPDTGLPFSKPRFRLEGGRLVLIPNPLADADAYRALLADPVPVLRSLGAGDPHFRDRVRPSPLDGSAAVRLARIAWSKGAERAALRARFDGADRDGALRLLLAILGATRDDAILDGAAPLIVVLPRLDEVAVAGDPVYEPLLAALRERGWAHVDVRPALRAAGGTSGVDGLFVGAHYSARGNLVVARRVADAVRGLGAAALSAPPPR